MSKERKGWREGGVRIGERCSNDDRGQGGGGGADLTRPPGQPPCHCRGGEGQTMGKPCLNKWSYPNTLKHTSCRVKLKVDELKFEGLLHRVTGRHVIIRK